MSEIEVGEASKSVQDMFNKGFAAFERGNLDYAIDMLFSCIEQEPRLLKARRFLRSAEIQRYQRRQGGVVGKTLDRVRGLPGYVRAMATVKSGKPLEALLAIEQLLRRDPLNPQYVKLFAQVASAADLPGAAIQTLEKAREHHPRDISILNWLGALYQKVGRTSSARECFEKLCELCPNDPNVLKSLKDATALDSMKTDGWQEVAERQGTYRDLIRDTKEAAILEQQAKAVKSDRDVEALISENLAKIEAEPGNINYYRELARLYVQNDEHRKAIDSIRKAMEIMPGDPQLENALTDAQVHGFDYEARLMESAGDTAGAEAKRREKQEYLFKDITNRVERYPNDLSLRYKYGVMLFDGGRMDDAIQQFQLSQRNPKFRINSFYYLAMCFKRKKQYDLAVAQLERAASEIFTMDQTKKDILYELGQISEVGGDRKKAAEYYKQIYQVDIGYKDIARKVEEVYRDELS